MKGKNKSLIWMLPALFVLALNMPVAAQDDLYYDPSTDSKPVPTYQPTHQESGNNPSSSGSDDQYYEEDDYAYEYSSRIRRFHQPSAGMDYYDPMFIDLYHYDPYYMPGASIYTYGCNDYWAYRRWQTWNAYNPWNPWNPYAGYGYGMGWNSWTGWSVSVGYVNPWYNPYVLNRYYYDPYWTWNGHNPYYDSCMPSYGHYYYNNNNYYYNNGGGQPGGNNGYHPQTYVGPRRGGTRVNSGNYTRMTSGNGSNGRLVAATDTKTPYIDLQSTRPNGRATVDKAPATQHVTERATQDAGRKPSTTTAKDPAAIENAGRGNGKSDKTRPSTNVNTRPSRESLPGDNVPSNRTPTETRPSRQPSQETSPSRSPETRPSRSGGGSEEARPSRPSAQDRPSRSSGGSTETRPSRSSGSDGGSSKSWDSGSSGRSSSGNSGGSSGSSRSSGGSSGGGSKSSGGGSKGRN